MLKDAILSDAKGKAKDYLQSDEFKEIFEENLMKPAIRSIMSATQEDANRTRILSLLQPLLTQLNFMYGINGVMIMIVLTLAIVNVILLLRINTTIAAMRQ